MRIFSYKPLLSIFGVLCLVSCGVPQAEHDKLLTEVSKLKAEIEDLENGQERLEAKYTKAMAGNDLVKARETLNAVNERHPQSELSQKYDTLIANIDSLEQIENLRLQQEKDEAQRLENLNNTGMWQVTNYVDDFGEPTSDGYIRNLRYINGLFSNTATQNSDLNVRFLIEPKQVAIMLYEYAGNNPVKAYSTDEYIVLMQDNNGERYRLNAKNYSDRLVFGPSHSQKVQAALKIGGTVKFRIYESDTPTTQYNFEIKQAKYFDNAYRLLTD